MGATSLSALQAGVVEFFARSAPEAVAADALASVAHLCRAPLSPFPRERVSELAGILTTLLFAANETGLAELRAYSCACKSAQQALDLLRIDALEPANADTVARCFSRYWELLRLSKVWAGQVKTVAWRRLQSKLVQ